MKRIFLGIGLIIIFFIPTLLILPSFLSWNEYKTQIADIVKEQSGLDISIGGDLKIAILPTPYAYANDIVISNPESADDPDILKLKRLDLKLELLPLMSGQVALSSLSFVQPEIVLSQSQSGTWNWQTEALDKITNADAPGGSEGGSVDVAFERISIEDASVRYNAVGGTPITVQDVNLELSAESLSGPFFLNGDFNAFGRDIGVSIKTGRLDDGAESVPVNLELVQNDLGGSLKYSGVVSFGQAFDIQGQTDFNVQNLSALLAEFGVNNNAVPSDQISGSGLLSVNAEGGGYKNLDVRLGDDVLRGDVSSDSAFSSLSFNFEVIESRRISQFSGATVKGGLSRTSKGEMSGNVDMRFGEAALSGSARYAPSEGSRGHVDVNVNAKNVDLNPFIKEAGSAEGGASTLNAETLKAQARSFVLPVDVAFDVTAENLRSPYMDLKGLVAKGAMKEKSLNIERLLIQDLNGVEVTVIGDVSDLSTLDGINMRADVVAGDVDALGGYAGVELPEFTGGVSRSVLGSLEYKGDLQTAQLTVNAKAMDATLIAVGQISDVLTAADIKNLTVQLLHPNLNKLLTVLSGAGSGYSSLSKPLDIFARFEKNNTSVSMRGIKGKIAGTSVQGSLDADLSASVPALSGELGFGALVLTSSSAATGSTSAQSSSARWSNDPLNVDALKLIDVDLSVTAQSLDYNSWLLKSPKLKIVLDDGQLQVKDLSAGLYDGEIFSDITLKAPAKSGQAVSFDMASKMRSVSMEPLIESLTGGQILQGSGLIDMDIALAGQGASQSALVNSLSGEGALTGENLLLDGFDLKRFARALSSETKPGDTVLGLWKTTTKGGQTQFDSMDGSLTVQNGIVGINKIDLDGPDAFVSMTGQVSLPAWTIETQNEITLKEEQAAPAFAVKISGPLDDPAQTFGQGALNDYLNRKIQRKLNDFLGDKLGIGGSKSTVTTDDTVPATAGEGAGQETSTDSASEKEVDLKEEALKGLIRGLLQ